MVQFGGAAVTDNSLTLTITKGTTYSARFNITNDFINDAGFNVGIYERAEKLNDLHNLYFLLLLSKQQEILYIVINRL